MKFGAEIWLQIMAIDELALRIISFCSAKVKLIKNRQPKAACKCYG